MKKTFASVILAAMLTLTACTSAADNEKKPDTTPTETVTETVTEVPTEEVTEAPTENSTETIIRDISDTKKSLTCYVDGGKIPGLIYLPEGDGPFPATILISGLGATYASVENDAKYLAENGIAGVIFDCRGYYIGHVTDGKYVEKTPSTCVTDIMAVTDIISEYPAIDKDNIFLWGHSYGGLITTLTAAENPDRFKGLMCVDPAYFMPDECRLTYLNDTAIPETDDFDFVIQKHSKELLFIDIFEKMKSYSNKAIIFTGTDGTNHEVDPRLFERAIECFPDAELNITEGANHFFTHHREELDRLTVEFVKNNSDNIKPLRFSKTYLRSLSRLPYYYAKTRHLLKWRV